MIFVYKILFEYSLVFQVSKGSKILWEEYVKVFNMIYRKNLKTLVNKKNRSKFRDYELFRIISVSSSIPP